MPKNHRGIQTICIVLLLLSRVKQGSAINGTVEGEYGGLMREHPGSDAFV